MTVLRGQPIFKDGFFISEKYQGILLTDPVM